MFAPEGATAERAANRAFSRMDSLEKLFSDWDPSSEVGKLTKVEGRKQVSGDLWEVLSLSIKIAEGTGGSFHDVSGAR